MVVFIFKITGHYNFGFYSLTVPEGEFDINFSFIGYSDFTKILLIKTDLELNTRLVLSSNIIKEVVLTDQVSNVQQTQTSVISVPVIQIKSMPALLGEIDVLKSIQLLPGVQSGSEGSSGFYVRGGGPDQNLILLDGVPVYNASHLFGFFSVFNIDAIKNVKLTKGGFPARFGGRLSSVLEIDMKEGNMKEFKGEGSIGLISSKLALEGPIVKDKGVTVRPNFCSTSSSKSNASFPSRSSLFIKTIIGILRILHTSTSFSVCSSTPFETSMTTITLSTAVSVLNVSSAKSLCPGVSKIFIFLSL